MNYKIKKLITNWRVILLALFIFISLIAIHPVLSEGVAIRSVITNSSASIAGIPQPKPNILPVSRERIVAINNQPIKDIDDYNKQVSNLAPNRTITIKTNKGLYKLATSEYGDIGLRVYDAPKTNIRKGLDLQGGTRVLLKPEAKLSKFDMS